MKNKELTQGHPIFRIGGDTCYLIREEVCADGVYLQSSFDLFRASAREFMRDEWFDITEFNEH